MKSRRLFVYLCVFSTLILGACSDSSGDSTQDSSEVGEPGEADASLDGEGAADVELGDDADAGEDAGDDRGDADSGEDAGPDGGPDVDEPDLGDPDSPFNLDESGRSVPDTDYAIPDGAIFMATTGADANAGTEDSPVKTLNRAVALASEGGTIVIRGGVYHDGYAGADDPYRYKIITKVLTYQAYPHEQVWFDGTEVQPAEKWTADGEGRWWMDWSTPQFCEGKYYDFKYDAQPQSNDGPCAHRDANSAPEFPAATDPQMVFVDGEPLKEVIHLSEVRAGQFYYDWENRRLYIPVDPGAHEVAAAVRTNAMVIGASGSAIKGIGFRRYATNEQSNLTGAAVYMGGSDYRVENNLFTENAAGSLYMGPQRGVMHHNAVVNNGYSSHGGNGHSEKEGVDNLVISNNLISNNNTENFHMYCDISCGQAGMKMAHMEGFTVRGNIFKNSAGHGFWCDLNCSGAIIVNNLIMNNKYAGIFYEVSSDGIIASNMLIHNGDYGLRVTAATTKIYNNTIITNDARGGMWIYDDNRNAQDTHGTEVGPDTRGVEVVNNLTYNTHATVSSLSAQGTDTSGTNTVPDEFFTAVDYNAYYRQEGPSKRLVRWITPDGETTYYSASDFSAATGFDTHAIDISDGGDPFFVDVAAADYRVRPDSPAAQSAAALPADVAAAIGVTTDAGQDRGALIWPGR